MTISAINSLDGNLLVTFCAVAEELNFARAAERLHISQPPLTRRVQRLEALVRAALFERTTRSVRLTPAGAIMYEHAKRVLADMQYMLASVHEVARGESGRLSIGITPTAAASRLVSCLHAFRMAHPHVALDLHEMDSVQIWEELRQGRIDVALMRPVQTHDSIEMTTVHSEPLRFVTRHEHGYAGGRVSLAQIIQHPLVGYHPEHSPYLARLFGELLAQAPGPARIVQLSRLPSILTLVEAGVGAAIVPDSIASAKTSVLRYHAIEPDAKSLAHIVVARPREGRNPAAVALIGALLAEKE